MHPLKTESGEYVELTQQTPNNKLLTGTTRLPTQRKHTAAPQHYNLTWSSPYDVHKIFVMHNST